MRTKFAAKPGKQSMIRRAAPKAVHKAFRENGIHAVPKPLTGERRLWRDYAIILGDIPA